LKKTVHKFSSSSTPMYCSHLDFYESCAGAYRKLEGNVLKIHGQMTY
jgi:hypothetical protein